MAGGPHEKKKNCIASWTHDLFRSSEMGQHMSVCVCVFHFKLLLTWYAVAVETFKSYRIAAIWFSSHHHHPDEMKCDPLTISLINSKHKTEFHNMLCINHLKYFQFGQCRLALFERYRHFIPISKEIFGILIKSFLRSHFLSSDISIWTHINSVKWSCVNFVR